MTAPAVAPATTHRCLALPPSGVWIERRGRTWLLKVLSSLALPSATEVAIDYCPWCAARLAS